MFVNGERQLEDARNYADKIIGLISLDLAVETLLKIIAKKHPKSPKELNFTGLIEQTKSFLSENNFGSFPDEANIRKVRSRRNQAQHEAESPNDRSLSDCRTYTLDFLTKLICQIWNVEFTELNVLELIESGEVRALLTKAYTQLNENKYLSACVSAKMAFDRVVGELRGKIIGMDASVFYPGRLRGGDEMTTYQFQAIASEINELKGLVLQALLRIDPADLNRYQITANAIHISTAYDEGHKVLLKRSEFSREEALFVTDFVANVVVDVQARGLTESRLKSTGNSFY